MTKIIHKYTFGEAVERYIRNVTAHKKGSKEERYLLVKLKQTGLWQKQISSITPRDIATYQDDRAKYSQEKRPPVDDEI